MLNPKNQCYQDQQTKTFTTKSVFNRINGTKFQFDKISQIDDLLSKNDQIYKNLRIKLQQINQAQKNITNNINVIRPIYYQSRSKENSLRMYQKFMYDSGYGEKSLQFDNFDSSPIQTERHPTEIIKKKSIQQQNISILNECQQQNNQSSQIQIQKQSQVKEDYTENNKFRPTNTNDLYIVSEPLIRRTNSSIQSNPRININLTQSTNKSNSIINLRQSQSILLSRKKQNNYFPINNSYEPYVDSIVNMNFVELNQRKQDIQNIYDQLKLQEEQIEKAYRQYKKGFTEINKITSNKPQQNAVKSPPKNPSSPIKSFGKGKKQEFQAKTSKIPSVSSKIQITPILMKQSKMPNTNNLSQKNQTNLSTVRQQSNQKLSFSPINQTPIKYYTQQQIQSIEIPEKPQPMTAISHIYVPFNKLYKSPIIQMKNKNILILARQSKLEQQKTAQLKILDGKKYKFPQNVETDQQQLIKNVIRQDHNIVAIVGGQSTLKKKLHMSIIAHSFDKIIKIINSKEYNCLTFSLSYHELIEKSLNQSQKINNFIEIDQKTSIKTILLESQKTIQEIYQAIKKPHNLNESSGFSKTHAQSSKDKLKIVRFTKLSLSSGKQSIWVSHIFSANQFTYEFLKNLEVKDIIWSINPLVKNYDEVSKTLNEATKYIQNKIQG